MIEILITKEFTTWVTIDEEEETSQDWIIEETSYSDLAADSVLKGYQAKPLNTRRAYLPATWQTAFGMILYED